MKKNLKRSIITLVIEFFVGLVAILITVFGKDRLSDNTINYLRSFGNALFVVSIALLIRTIRLAKNKDLAEKMEIASTDERNILLRQKAATTTLMISLMVEAFGGFLLALFGYETVGLTLCAAYAVQTMMYFIAFMIYAKKN